MTSVTSDISSLNSTDILNEESRYLESYTFEDPSQPTVAVTAAPFLL